MLVRDVCHISHYQLRRGGGEGREGGEEGGEGGATGEVTATHLDALRKWQL